ncbi:hypothetical protein [Streptomyces sp. NPDC014622]|uniref:hypothetical protein n=1 Tax=Streptomyces sp. NPDC014622 TaxID=3364874 RepID=UPI0036FC361F
MSKRSAYIYFETAGAFTAAEELDKINALRVFAVEQGWELLGALIEPSTLESSRLWCEIEDAWDTDEVTAVITWDDELSRPVVWVDQLLK